MNDNLLKLIIALVGAILAALITVLIYFLKKKDDELNLIKNKISDEKYKAYFAIVNLFFDLMKQDKGLIQLSKDDLTLRYIDIKRSLLMLGSDEILRKWGEFDNNFKVADEKKSLSKILQWLELFILIRKDSGNPKTKLTPDDLLKHILATEADYLAIKSLILKHKLN